MIQFLYNFTINYKKMAAEYRFLDTANNIDAIIVTDHVRNASNFFVTDKRNYDSNDITGGIDIGIALHTELEFITMAMDLSVALYRSMDNSEECLVLPGVQAGAFNGSTSSIRFETVPIASSSVIDLPWTFGCTFRLSEEDVVDLLDSDSGFQIIASDPSEFTNVSALLSPSGPSTFELSVSVIISRFAQFSVSADLGDFIANECMTLSVRVAAEGADFIMEASINGDMIGSAQTSAELTATVDDLDFVYGARFFDDAIDPTFKGIMRDLFFTDGSGDLINVPDPSTGVNSGSAGNGTVTDVTSVTVIV